MHRNVWTRHWPFKGPSKKWVGKTAHLGLGNTMRTAFRYRGWPEIATKGLRVHRIWFRWFFWACSFATNIFSVLIVSLFVNTMSPFNVRCRWCSESSLRNAEACAPAYRNAASPRNPPHREAIESGVVSHLKRSLKSNRKLASACWLFKWMACGEGSKNYTY